MLPQQPARTYVFDCDSNAGPVRVVTRAGPGELAIWLPEPPGGRYLVLGQVRAASGAKYEGDGVVFWNRGEEAMLSVDGIGYPGCTLNRPASIWEHAKLSGVDYRAVGNEPGWHMEIRDGDRISVTYDYGESTLEVAAPEPTVDAANRRSEYRVGDLHVLIVGEPCSDTMSGEAFESRVTVRIDGRELHGCGRALH